MLVTACAYMLSFNKVFAARIRYYMGADSQLILRATVYAYANVHLLQQCFDKAIGIINFDKRFPKLQRFQTHQ